MNYIHGLKISQENYLESNLCKNMNNQSLKAFLKKNGGIYLIKNEINNKIYIGSTKNFFNRFKEYKRYERYRNMPICLALKKYKPENFSFYVIYSTEETKETELLDIESYFILKHKSNFKKNGYNVYIPNDKSSMPDYTKRKIRTSCRKNCRKIISEKEVVLIKKDVILGFTQEFISKKYSVSRSLISSIINGRCWSHVKLSKNEEDQISTIKNKNKRKIKKEDIEPLKSDIKKMTIKEVSEKWGLSYFYVAAIKRGEKLST